MKKYLLMAVLFSSSLSFFISPSLVIAQAPPKLDYSGFVDCDGVPAKTYDKNGIEIGIKPGEEDRQNTCDFVALMRTVNKMINWMFTISISVATVLFAYAGLLYIRGTSASRTQANKIFTSVGIGFIIMLVAWISVRTVVGWFVVDDSSATTFLEK